MTLSPDQERTLSTIMTWFSTVQTASPESQDTQCITLGGYAGTGKTTLIGVMRKEFAKHHKDLKVGFASYTGKAARVLKTKLTE